MTDGEHLLVADSEAEFARATLAMIDDVDLAKRLGEGGRAMVERTYRWSSIVAQLEQFHQRLLDSRRSG